MGGGGGAQSGKGWLQAGRHVHVQLASQRDAPTPGALSHNSPCLTLLPADERKAEAVGPLKEFGPERARVLGGGGLEGPGTARLGCDKLTPVWLTGLHASVRHTKGQGLILWVLQQSL